jgi:hypothetical protein
MHYAIPHKLKHMIIRCVPEDKHKPAFHDA